MSLQTFDQVAMGMRICLSREHAALSREQLAECLGITPKFLANIERGSRGLAMQKFILLVQILNVSADYLIFGNNAED